MNLLQSIPVDVCPVLLPVLDGGGELLLEDARLAPQLHVAFALRTQRPLVARLQLKDLLVRVLLSLTQHLLHSPVIVAQGCVSDTSCLVPSTQPYSPKSGQL